jgi:hypothetical protein
MMDDDERGAIGEVIGGKTEVLWGILPKSHIVHHKSHKA